MQVRNDTLSVHLILQNMIGLNCYFHSLLQITDETNKSSVTLDYTGTLNKFTSSEKEEIKKNVTYLYLYGTRNASTC